MIPIKVEQLHFTAVTKHNHKQDADTDRWGEGKGRKRRVEMDNGEGEQFRLAPRILSENHMGHALKANHPCWEQTETQKDPDGDVRCAMSDVRCLIPTRHKRKGEKKSNTEIITSIKNGFRCSNKPPLCALLLPIGGMPPPSPPPPPAALRRRNTQKKKKHNKIVAATLHLRNES